MPVFGVFGSNNKFFFLQFIVEYCTKYPDAAQLMPEELSSCKEMAELMPLKIHRLTQLLEQTTIT